MAPAHYGVIVEACRSDGTGYTLLRLGPYTRTWLAGRDADRLNSELQGRAATVLPGLTVTAREPRSTSATTRATPPPHDADITALLADAIAERARDHATLLEGAEIIALPHSSRLV